MTALADMVSTLLVVALCWALILTILAATLLVASAVGFIPVTVAWLVVGCAAPLFVK